MEPTTSQNPLLTRPPLLILTSTWIRLLSAGTVLLIRLEFLQKTWNLPSTLLETSCLKDKSMEREPNISIPWDLSLKWSGSQQGITLTLESSRAPTRHTPDSPLLENLTQRNLPLPQEWVWNSCAMELTLETWLLWSVLMATILGTSLRMISQTTSLSLASVSCLY